MEATPRKHHLYLILASLYVAQSIPMSFFTSAVPALMRQGGYSLESIGILQLVKLPWILKLLWAPLIDGKASGVAALRKWIIGSELFYACTVSIIGFFSLETNFGTVAVLIIIAVVASATQDICTDSFAINVLEKKRHGVGAGLQSMGGFIGSLVGGGILLIVYHRSGWQSLIFSLSLVVLVSLVPLLLFRPANRQSRDIPSDDKIKFGDIALYFRRKNVWKDMLFLVLYSAPVMATLAMLRPYMVDLGQSIDRIGIVTGIAGTSSAALSSCVAGMLIKKYGQKPNIVGFSIFILAAVLFISLVSCFENVPHQAVYAAVALIWCAHGFAMVMIYSVAMGKVRNRRSGTDFTLQTVVVQLSGLILSAVGGQIAGKFSYLCLFAFGLLLGICSLIYVATIYKTQLDDE
jgi:predicted MFS family arabinose efflux permease